MKHILQALALLLAVAVAAILLLRETGEPAPAETAAPSNETAAPEAHLRLERLSLVAGDDLLIPLARLREYEVAMVVRIEELQLGFWQLRNVRIEVASDRQTMQARVAAKGLGGRLVASIATDLKGAGSSRLLLAADEVRADDFTGIAGLTGRLQVNSELRFTGGRLGELAASIAGASSFNIQDGRLDVTPIKRMSLGIDTARGRRSSVSDWPDAMPFQLMTGRHHFGGGVSSGQTFNAELGHLAITGQGGFDLGAKQLDYEITTVFDSAGEAPFTVPRQILGGRWAMRCRGTMAGPVLNLCFGEDARIATTVRNLAQARQREQALSGDMELNESAGDLDGGFK